MYVAGVSAMRRRMVESDATCMRRWRRWKSGRPSSSKAMTSPSIRASRVPSVSRRARVTSGYWELTSRPVRLSSRTRPGSQ